MNLEPLPSGESLPECPDFLQSDFWAAFKESFGWKALRFRMEIAAGGKGKEEAGLLVLLRGLPFGFSFAYVAHGPHLDATGMPADPSGLSLEYSANAASSDWGAEPQKAFAERLLDIAACLGKRIPRRCVFIRFDLPHYRERPMGQAFPAPFRKAVYDVQPPDTVVIDLRPGEDAILAAMKPKWRYNVKLAEKKGIDIELLDAKEAGDGDVDAAIDDFYDLYRETARRDRIALHGKDYYLKLFRLAAEFPGAPRLRLYRARHEGATLAAIIVLIGRTQAVYLYGASSNEGRNLMPAYALQWRAMRDAKAAGCDGYDLFGIPPDDDPRHPMHGLYRFKTGFGGRILHRLGCHDYPVMPAAYAAFRLAEGLRAFWYKRLVKLGRGEGRRAGAEDRRKETGS